MSKEAGFVVPPDHHYAPSAPSAPPSYEEAIQQAAMPMPTPYAVHPLGNQMNMHQPPPPPQTYPPQGVPVQPMIASQEPATIIVASVPLGRGRCNMRCPSCNVSIRTETVEEPHGFAHACCCLLFFVGCCLFSCLPYCMDSCKTVTHRCPNCKANLGTFNPF